MDQRRERCEGRCGIPVAARRTLRFCRARVRVRTAERASLSRGRLEHQERDPRHAVGGGCGRRPRGTPLKSRREFRARRIVHGVNQNEYNPDEVNIFSAASCTTNAITPILKAIEDTLGVVKGHLETIHAYTNDQNTLDAPHPKGDLRRARAAAANIVPNSTGAAKAIGLVLPELKGKLDGGAQRIPVITGSLTELTSILNKTVTADEINAAMKAAGNESFGYTEDEIVSSDIIGIHFGSLFDATQTKVMTVGDKQLVKTVSWYDNEMSYVSQLVRTVHYFANLIS